MQVGHLNGVYHFMVNSSFHGLAARSVEFSDAGHNQLTQALHSEPLVRLVTVATGEASNCSMYDHVCATHGPAYNS